MADTPTTSLTNLTASNHRIVKLRFGREVLTQQTELLGFDLQGSKPDPAELSSRPEGVDTENEPDIKALLDALIHLNWERSIKNKV